MALNQRLDIRTAQTLVMTPQLQQAIKLLQMSNLELGDFVAAEIEKNPLLKNYEPDYGEDATGGGNGDDAAQSNEPLPASESQNGDSAEQVVSETFGDSNDAPLDTDYENVYAPENPRQEYGLEEGRIGGDASGSASYDGQNYDPFATISETKSLRDHLTEQINMEIGDPARRMIALTLIGQIDEAGYLNVDVAAVAQAMGTEAEIVQQILDQLKTLDPTGICASGLKECLAIQLHELDRYDPAMQSLIENLELLGERKYDQLKRLCHIDDEDLAQMLSEIRRLDPKPASRFEHQVAQSIIPDILMRQKSNGEWMLELNTDTLPRVLVDQQFYTDVSKSARTRDEKDYLSSQFTQANWLVRALEQRANTILRAAAEIVRRQDQFFIKGVSGLKPMTLKDVAQEIEMHESTVSRVTNNKYIATPRGVIELKYFFSSSLGNLNGSSADGENTGHSTEAVRHRIRELIDAEDPKKILSDDKLVELLTAEGIDIARRTVAKYREAMNIGSSVQRRREKKAKKF